MRARLLATLGVVAILGLAFLLGREGQTPGTRTESPGQQADYGYVALDADVTQTGADGQPLYRLTAARIEQSPGSGDASADTLTLNYAPNELQRWTLTAREALLPGDDNRVLHLKGDVLVSGKPPGSDQLAQFSTQGMDFDTRTQDVTTPLPVTFTWSGQRLTATGLAANLKDLRFRLNASVHGRFVP